MKCLEDKVALVTGSARGIGRAIAERFGALGASVVINYASDERSAAETVAAIQGGGGSAVAIQTDVSRSADVERLFWSALERFGRLDIVVANAGVELVGRSVLESTEDDFDKLFSINTKGTFFTLQNAARHVADNGRIIYVGSSNTAFPLPGRGLYGGSKITPLFLVEVLAKEIGHRGVAINSILPTATEGAGVYAAEVKPEFREFIKAFNPM